MIVIVLFLHLLLIHPIIIIITIRYEMSIKERSIQTYFGVWL